MILQIISEIRFLPIPRFMDIRGSIAEHLITENLTDWVIDTDRVIVKNKNGNVFVSLGNTGFAVDNIKDFEKFLDSFDNGLKFIGDLPPVRWGVRFLALIPYKGNFEQLRNQHKSKLLNNNSQHFQNIGGNLTDIGLTYVFTKEHETKRVNIGPMEIEQAKTIFGDRENLPKVGTFIDLDIYREKNQFYKDDFRRSRIVDFINSSYKNGEDIINKMEAEFK